MLRWVASALIILTFLGPGSASAGAAPRLPDWSLPGGGHFYTQTDPNGERGFSVTNQDGIDFWDVYLRYGGPAAWGYPTSKRFDYQGFTTQVFQRAVFQWDNLKGQVNFLNVLDLLHDTGQDPWLLLVRQTPRPANVVDLGKPWAQVVAERQAWLEPQPALKQRYFSAVEPIAVFGLPTSQIADMGNHFAIRLQRAVLQLWKVNVPWAAAGDVTVALAGDLAREGGLFKESSIWSPEEAPAPASAIGAGPEEHWIDVDLSNQQIYAYVGGTPVFQAPMTSGKPGFDTPTGLFRIQYRVYKEIMDSTTIGILQDSTEGYRVTDVYFTQYFAAGGYALHANYWQPPYVFGHTPTSHGCVGMFYDDAHYFWDFSEVGTRVFVHY